MLISDTWHATTEEEFISMKLHVGYMPPAPTLNIHVHGQVHMVLKRTMQIALLKKKARGVLGLRGVTAQGVLWQHTRVLS